MSEWGVDPIHIREKWTEELLMLMIEKMVDRKYREAAPKGG